MSWPVVITEEELPDGVESIELEFQPTDNRLPELKAVTIEICNHPSSM